WWKLCRSWTHLPLKINELRVAAISPHRMLRRPQRPKSGFRMKGSDRLDPERYENDQDNHLGNDKCRFGSRWRKRVQESDFQEALRHQDKDIQIEGAYCGHRVNPAP